MANEDSSSGTSSNEGSATGGAKGAPTSTSDRSASDWIYGPKEDSKVNPDGSTKPNTWTSPDKFEDAKTATDKLDPFKPVEGRRPVTIPPGTETQRGTTLGHEGPYDGSGGANETLIPNGAAARMLWTLGASSMKFRYELRPELVTQARALEEFANGATKVSVLLRNGRRVPDVLLSDGKYVVAVRGHLDLPFRLEEVVEIYQSDDDRNPRQRSGWKYWDDWER